jgi:hypothetical protein
MLNIDREVSKYLVNSSVTLFSDAIATDISWMRRKFNTLKRVVVDCGQHYVEEWQCLMGHLALRTLNFETNIQGMQSVNLVSLKTVILFMFYTFEILFCCL